jgi:quercetin dioxygenase-like cupin family protein
MKKESKYFANLNEEKTVEMLPNLFRTTLTYNDEIMVCHFIAKKGALVPLHNHEAVQVGYVIKGSIRFFKKNDSSFIAVAGSGYLFNSDEYHGSEALEDTEFIECFAPMRQEYVG